MSRLFIICKYIGIMDNKYMSKPLFVIEDSIKPSDYRKEVFFTLTEGIQFVPSKKTLIQNFCGDNENMTLVDNLFIYGKYFIDTNENSNETSDDNVCVFNLCHFMFINLKVNDIDYYIINSHTRKYAVFRSRHTQLILNLYN